MQAVSTPANGNIAPVGARIAAFLLDSLFLAIYLAMLFSAVSIDVIDVDDWWFVMALLVAIPLFAYGLLFELLMNGQTPGKRIVGIRVVKLDGTAAEVANYLLRWVFGLVDFILLFGVVATVIIAAGGKGQRLGDIVAGTCVVRSSPRARQSAYNPVFPQVIHLDIYYVELISRALGAHRDHDNSTPVSIVSQQIKTLLGIQSDMPPVQFLSAIVKDFNHLKAR